MLYSEKQKSSIFLKITKLIALLFAALTINLLLSTAHAQNFPEGNFKGTGFSVEKNGQVLFQSSQVYSYNSSLKIKSISKDVVKVNLSVRLKPTANAAEIGESREDRFKIIWETDTTGKLQNLSPKLKSDKSSFVFTNEMLTIKSWIQRTGTWETQYYKRP
jgi:hypothetical protein